MPSLPFFKMERLEHCLPLYPLPLDRTVLAGISFIRPYNSYWLLFDFLCFPLKTNMPELFLYYIIFAITIFLSYHPKNIRGKNR